MTTAGSSTLRERIAALQQRGTSPQPTSPPRSQTPTNHAGGGLRDKIARFEEKGGTPIPRGSFGLGAPPKQAGKRNNEMWGNRMASTGQLPSGSGSTALLGRAATLSVGASARSRRVSTSDAHLSPSKKLQFGALSEEPMVLEDKVAESDMIKSLDIANSNPTPSSKDASPVKQGFMQPSKASTTPLVQEQALPGIAINGALSTPTSSVPSIIIIGKDEMNLSTTLLPAEQPPDVEHASHISDNSKATILKHLGAAPSEVNIAVAGENKQVGANNLNTTSPLESQTDEPPIVPVLDPSGFPSLEHSLNTPADGLLAVSANASPDNLILKFDSSDANHADDDTAKKPVIEELPPESLDSEAHGHPIPTLGKKVALTNIDHALASHSVSSEPQALPEPSKPKSSSSPPPRHSSPVLQIPSNIQISHNTKVSDGPQAVAPAVGGSSLPIASISMPEVPSESPRVTPILDAFPAVPHFLPPASAPTRAHTISHRSAVHRSSTSSTKSTPSLSFSSTSSSSTCSPTFASNTPQPPPSQPPDSRRPSTGLQRSKSHSRPISSVPAWYDDDSDDGEAGWANVIVTRRYY
ncbi:hypothetical protein K439DRAFT_1172231 [Ramaria rubella]|nr:hypothetical protein K439DRAFT_1172231 [Ramaria rubella]